LAQDINYKFNKISFKNYFMMKFLFNILAASIVDASSNNGSRNLLTLDCVDFFCNCEFLASKKSFVNFALAESDAFRAKINELSGTFVIADLSEAEKDALRKEFTDFYNSQNTILIATGTTPNTRDGSVSCLKQDYTLTGFGGVGEEYGIGDFWLDNLEQGTPITYTDRECRIDGTKVHMKSQFVTAGGLVFGNITEELWEVDEDGIYKLVRDVFDCEFDQLEADKLAAAALSAGAN